MKTLGSLPSKVLGFFLVKDVSIGKGTIATFKSVAK